MCPSPHLPGQGNTSGLALILTDSIYKGNEAIITENILNMGLCDWPDAMEEGKLSAFSSSALYGFVASTTWWSMEVEFFFVCFSPRTSLINQLSNSYTMEWQKWSCFLRNVSGGKVFKGLGVSLLYLMGPLAHKHIKQRNNRSLGEFLKLKCRSFNNIMRT